MAFLSAEPARVGAVETLEFVVRSVGWSELTTQLKALRDSSAADFRNRDLARSALAASDPKWPGGAYRSFMTEER